MVKLMKPSDDLAKRKSVESNKMEKEKKSIDKGGGEEEDENKRQNKR